MSDQGCLICERIKQIQQGINPFFIIELQTGHVVMGDFQFIKGYTLFLCKEHVFELHELKKEFKEKFLFEMSLVAEAVFRAFKPRKLNYELLGNTHGHLHWHLFPRTEDDLNPKGPVWQIDKNLRTSADTIPSKEEIQIIKYKILNELKKLLLY